VPVGDAVVAHVTITAQSGSRVSFYTAVRDAGGSVVQDGTALALMRPQGGCG
jgi:hypothetical protein